MLRYCGFPEAHRTTTRLIEYGDKKREAAFKLLSESQSIIETANELVG